MDRKKENLSLINDAWNYGVTLTLTVISIYIIKGKLLVLYGTNLSHFYSSLGLAIIALVTFFLYSINTKREINILHSYISADSIPRINNKVFFTVIGLAITFGLLIVFCDDIFKFSIILLALNFFDTLGEIQTSKNIDNRIREEQEKADKKSTKKILNALRKYYNYRVIFTIQFVSFTVNWIAFCFAVIFQSNQIETNRLIASIIIIINIIVTESYIGMRRKRRDKVLNKNE